VPLPERYPPSPDTTLLAPRGISGTTAVLEYGGEIQGHAEPLQAHRALQESVSRSGVEAHGADGKERAIPMAHLIPRTPSRGRDLVLGFLAGALAVMTFHQGMVFLLSTVRP
jgi:hypothetical protein